MLIFTITEVPSKFGIFVNGKQASESDIVNIKAPIFLLALNMSTWIPETNTCYYL